MKEAKTKKKTFSQQLDEATMWKPNSKWLMKTVKPYDIFPNPNDRILFPTWWDRLLSWIGFKRNSWYMRRVYKSFDEIAGKSNDYRH